MNMQTTDVTSTTSFGGVAIPLSWAISPLVIQLTASSAALRAGKAAANYVSQSVLMAFASSAIFLAAASSTDTLYLTSSASAVYFSTIMSFSAVSLPV